MKNKKSLFMVAVLISTQAWASDFIHLDFKLQDLDHKDCESQEPHLGHEHKKLIGFIQDPKFWERLVADGRHKNDPRLDRAIIILPAKNRDKSSPEEVRALGLTARESLQMAGDQLQDNWCAEGHDQGTLNNRYCHSAISRSFANWLESKGVDGTAASIAGGIFWAPKEFFIDKNPSAHDIAFTYVDKLGTKRTTLEVTVFGDAFFQRYVGKGFAPLKSSTPFITLRRKF